jgi:hypothetical protein
LLIVLGMLSLFTVLVVSFVVFSSQMADSSFASQERRQNELPPTPPLEEAALQLIIGTDDSASAAYGASLLEDFYGTDGFEMRVAHRRGRVIPGPFDTKLVPAIPQGQLLLPLDARNRPRTTLFKFPTHLVRWHYDGDPGVVTPPPVPIPPATIANQQTQLTSDIDDALAGRIITFVEGPLKNIPFRIVRSFGHDNGTPDQGDSIGQPTEYNLAGNVVIDLSEVGTETITIDGVPESLYDVAANNPNRLLYDTGPDEEPGRAGVADNLGQPFSDDVGFRFVLNGAVFNGRGINPAGVTGVRRNGNNLDDNAHIEFTLNSRLTGTDYQGGNTSTGAYPEPDEGWDAPDMENIFLAWQPSDHRRSFTPVYQQFSPGDPLAQQLDRELGQHIIPSFHRPALINYLMNAPIWIPSDVTNPSDPNYIERTFADIKASPSNASPQNDGARLLALATRLRRAVLRPLNVPHLYVDANTSDLNGDGDPFDGAPFFSGSNPTPVLNRPLNLDGNLATAISEIEELATWLINGPWDVDNDGDGLPDSVWVDLDLPTVTAPDGKILKPLVAPLIEDWDGKINVNYAGTYNQLLTQRFPANPPPSYNNDLQYFQTTEALKIQNRGGGLGPAEIDFSHLFNFDFSSGGVPAGYVGPVATTQTGNAINIDAVLRTRYGNLLNSRYGGPIYNYALPYPYSSPSNRLANFLHLPGQGTRFNPQSGADQLARIPFPGRAINHQSDSVAGRPVDMAGMQQTTKDLSNGAHSFERVVPTGVSNEIVNQPYEFGATEIRGDDEPFSVAEQIDFIKGGPLNGRLSQLLGDAADRNEALRRLLVTESRSVDSPELPGDLGFVQFMARKIGNIVPAESKNLHVRRMLAVELRKGSKLNLNRQIGNEQDDNGDGRGDEYSETRTVTANLSGGGLEPNNTANNRGSWERAFPQIAGDYPNQAAVNAHYGESSMMNSGVVNDFDGVDTDNDGVLDRGTVFNVDVDGDGNNDRLRMADGSELLARHLYCLMFALLENRTGGGELVPNFPYPGNLSTAPVAARNRYVARRIAQWAANAVDYRDVDARCTRLRYDPDPFDQGFNLEAAALNTVWGMERPEVEISEAVAFHDKRLKRNLEELTAPDPATGMPTEIADDEDNDPTDMLDPDADMDQFRIPQASAYVELHSLRPPVTVRDDGAGNLYYGETQASLPEELYTNNALDLGRLAQLNPGNANDPTISPVWRLAVGQGPEGDRNRSTRWVFDARRLGEDLVADDGRVEELNYLDPPAFWSNAANVTDEVDDVWDAGIRQSAEIRDASSNAGAFVTIADPEFNPSGAAANDHRLRLERFVWLGNTRRAVARNWNLQIFNDAASGMRKDNTFFNFYDRVSPGDNTLPTNAMARLACGGYAVIGPRQTTRFGQTSLSTAPTYEYHPVNQRLEFALQNPAGLGLFRLNYFDLPATNDPTPLTPRYYEDRLAGGAPDYHGFHQAGVLPIICESFMPHELGPAGGPLTPFEQAWEDYLQTCVADPAVNGLPVDLGFNISAPLTGPNYYPAPTDRISPNGSGSGYPFRDGYRNYDPMAAGPLNLHPDIPFDHRPSSPLESTNYQMEDASGAALTVTLNAIGTHQEAKAVFLQRLADPTRPWHRIDNPYITVDFCPIDLTTFNGEGDASEPVDQDGDGDPTNDNWFADSARSNFDGTNFTPNVRMDSRRKIPDVIKDRVATRLVPENPAAGTDLSEHTRELFAQRSHLTATFNILRGGPTIAGPLPDGSTAYWPFQLGSAWTDQDLTDATDTVDTSFDPNLNLDAPGADFSQSLGYVNREYGFPLLWEFAAVPSNPQTIVSTPERVLMNMVSWMDREYRSELDLANVPATSRTGLLPTFGPGTRIPDRNITFETAGVFPHLLGFEQGYSEYRSADASNSRPLGIPQNTPGAFEGTANDDYTGERAGFEQIYDYVDVGPIWFDSQRWYDPSRIRFRQDEEIGNQVPAARPVYRLFNRTVETLQPPYNYVGRHRTPGKINLNTTPDYVRKAPRFNDPDATGNPFVRQREMLDAGENPANPDSNPTVPNPLASNPANFPVDGNGFSNNFQTSFLYGNGSVYRSLAWGMSTFYELDNTYGTPRTMGEPDLYMQGVDSNFGRGFKAFIESRRGYSTTLRAPAFVNPGSGAYWGNPQLDWRYPTQFAGVFAPARASATPSVNRFMRTRDADTGNTLPRRTHDMGLLRPHPDFDERLLNNTDRAAAKTSVTVDDSGNPDTNNFAIDIELEPTGGAVTIPGPENAGSLANVRDWEVSLLNRGLFERPQADLHKDFRNLDRDAYFKYRDAARMAGMTTNHSNVFHIRLTLSYFIVDPTTGAVGAEYVNETGEPLRSRANYVVDRTIPVGFLRGRDMDAKRTILYSEIEE